MKNISMDSATAFYYGRSFNRSNTSVIGNHFQLWGNEIAEIANGKLFLNNCGWETVTTKDRLNAILWAFDIPAKIVQKDWNWFYQYKTDEGVKKLPFPYRQDFAIDLKTLQPTEA